MEKITNQQICQMCHWSSGCQKCCKKCRGCGALQVCGLTDSQESLRSRWESWIHIKQGEVKQGEGTEMVKKAVEKSAVSSVAVGSLAEDLKIEMKVIKLANIKPSPFNSRKTFDEVKMKELTASVKEKGVISPILIRPVAELKGSCIYELVSGERRMRAAVGAGLTEIPTIIKQLNDQQALECMVIENLQREDVHPLEEAEGYEALMKKHGYKDVKDIAAKVGKSATYIYGRLKLCDLIPENRKYFFEGKFNPSVALLVARVPKHLQLAAGKEIVRGEDNFPVNYTEAKRYIEHNLMLQLKEVQFDLKDKTLAGKGSCAECIKRTVNQKELFADVKGADICTDPECFKAKKNAHVQSVIAKLKASGKSVVSQEEAKQLFQYQSDETPDKKYQAIDEHDYEWPTGVTVRKMLKAPRNKDIKTVFAIQPYSGKLIEMVDRKDLPAITKNAGLKLSQSGNISKAPDLAKIKANNRIIETCQRFWREKLSGMKDRRCLDVVLLFIALREMSFGDAEEFLDGVIKDGEWDASKLYALGETKIKELLDKAAVRRMQQADVDDGDLKFLCEKIGFSMAKDYVITKEYLEACTKEELLKLDRELGYGGEVKDESWKKSALVAHILKYAPKGKVPKELVK